MSEAETKRMAIENPFAMPGAISWHELGSADPEGSMQFYREVFGWEFQPMEMPDGTYNIIMVDGVGVGGIMKSPCEEGKTMWVNYITVGDIAETREKIEAAGGKALTETMTVPKVGRMFLFRDPQGGLISAIQYNSEESS